jgi:prepilin-type N-terminal cleavage/methylation domain-containing protein
MKSLFATAKKGKRHGFTLIEITVAIAVIGMIAGVIIARLGAAKQRSKATNAVQQFKSLERAINDRFAASGKYMNETDLDLGSNPTIGALITEGILSDYFNNEPSAGFGTTGSYLYDNDQVTGGDDNFYTGTDCTLDSADDDGVNIIVAGVFPGQSDIAGYVDQIVDDGDGFGCGKVKRNGSGGSLIYHISDRYDDVK